MVMVKLSVHVVIGESGMAAVVVAVVVLVMMMIVIEVMMLAVRTIVLVIWP